MRFLVLGPLRVEVGEDPVSITARRELVVLARLLLAPGRAIDAGRLIEDVWEGDPPASARGTLRVLVSRLRSRLDVGDGEQRIVSSPAGYELALTIDDELDAVQFDAEIHRASRLLDDDDASGAEAVFRRALDRWRGDAYGDLGSLEFVQPEAVRLGELWFVALEGRIEADMRLGRHRALIAELESLCAQHPLRESLWAQRMIALHRSGRRPEALRVYQDLRDQLGELVGLDPSPEVAELERAILSDELDTAVLRPARPVAVVVDSGSGSDLVARERELDSLLLAWDLATGGERQIALVHGEPGAGKSRLAEEVARRVTRSDCTVLHGHFDEEQILPYQGFMQALRSLRRDPPDWPDANLVEFLGRSTVPDASAASIRPTQDLHGRATLERHALHRAIEVALVESASERPVLLVLDDVQWADAASQLLLRHLAVVLVGVPIMILVTYRSNDVDAEPSVLSTLSRLHRLSGVTDVEVGPLPRAAVQRMIEEATPPGMPIDELADLVLGRTNGNAFFTTALVSTFDAASGIESARRSAVDVPNTVAEYVKLTVARLSQDARTVLAVASACSGSFRLSTLVAVSRLTREEVILGIDECVRARLLDAASEVDRLEFVHALVREVVYASLMPVRRADLHERLAESMENDIRTPGDHAEIAHHLAGAPTTAENARRHIDHARAAGDAAMSGLAYEAAADHYGAALAACDDLPDTDPRATCDLLLRSIRAHIARGHPGVATMLATRAVAEARRSGDDSLMVEAALLLEESQWTTTGFAAVDDSSSVAGVLREAIDRADRGPLRVELLARWPRVSHFGTNPAQRLDAAREAVDLAVDSGDDRLVAIAQEGLRWALWGSAGVADELRSIAEAVVRHASASEDIPLRTRGLVWRLLSALDTGDLPGLRDCVAALEEEGARSGEPLACWFPSMTEAMLAVLEGRLTDAETAVFTSVRIARRLELEWAVESVGIQLHQIRREQGRLAELADATVETATRHASSPAWQLGLAELHLRLGDHDAAERILRRHGPAIPAAPRDLTWLASAGLACDLALELDDVGLVAELYPALQPYADQNLIVGPGVVCLGSAALHLGAMATRLGLHDDASIHLDRAVAANAALGAPLLVARAHLARHTLLLARGERERARRDLAEAEAIASSSESAELRRQCEAAAGS